MSHHALVSIVIPTKEAAAVLPYCLSSIRLQSYKRFEVIIVDDLSKDGTQSIAEAYGAMVIRRRCSMAEARNIGIGTSSGRYLLMLDADMLLSSRLVEECVKRIEGGADALIIPELALGEGYWASCRRLEKLCYLGDSEMESARFFKKEVLMELGGYDASLLFGEDRDLMLRLLGMGKRIERCHVPLYHWESGLKLRDLMSKRVRYGLTLHHYWRKHPYAARRQLSPYRRAFFRNKHLLLKHPKEALGLLILKSLELSATALGALLGRVT